MIGGAGGSAAHEGATSGGGGGRGGSGYVGGGGGGGGGGSNEWIGGGGGGGGGSDFYITGTGNVHLRGNYDDIFIAATANNSNNGASYRFGVKIDDNWFETNTTETEITLQRGHTSVSNWTKTS
jgi:hypothetical protein